MSKKNSSKKASTKRVKIHAEVLPKTGTDRAEEAVAQAVIDACAPSAPAAETPALMEAKTTKKAKKPDAKAAKTPKEPRKPGILAIAADVLAKTKKAMTAKEIVDQALENKMWETNGKTPGATLYAAMIRDMAKKGSESRFLRAETKGQFCAAGK